MPLVIWGVEDSTIESPSPPVGEKPKAGGEGAFSGPRLQPSPVLRFDGGGCGERGVAAQAASPQ